MKSDKKKVFVGLSGGVDSSVSAAILKKAGYSVTGVFIRVWQPDFFECSWKDDRLDAMRVCAKLDIPFLELNLEKEYKKEVVDYMVREYRAGRTPNPDVMCNRHIKFGGFYEWALKKGADFVATGHYSLAARGKLFSGSDQNKDQSYFLWQIKKEQIPHILFPVGGMEKTEVRKLARKFGLITADKKDSQGLCFVGKIDMKEFLSHYIKPEKGNILDENGDVLGKHDGALFYTIGERVLGKYVIAKNLKKNTLAVASKGPAGELPRAHKEIRLKNCNWLILPRAGKTYSARVRYRQPLQKCRIYFDGHSVSIRFDSPQTVALGQSCVIYDGDIVLGGGIIS